MESSRPKRQFFIITFLLATTVCNIIVPIRLTSKLRNGYQNFTIFYAAGLMVRSGQTALLYDLDAQYRTQQEFAPNVAIRHGALPYNHPPFEALLFVPFTFLPYFPAYLLWTVLNLVMLAASLVILAKQFPEIGNLSVSFLVLAATGFLPIAGGIVQGQDSILLLLLFVLSLAALEHGNDATAGAMLALGLFKFHLVLPFALLLVFQRRRLLLGFLPIAGALALISLAMIGWHGVAGYATFLLRLDHTGAGGAIVGRDMPNLRGIISSVTGLPQGNSLLLLTITCSAVVALIAWQQMRAGRYSFRFSLVLAVIVAILVSYHTLTYDLSLLLPAVLLLFSSPVSDAWGIRFDLIMLASLYLVSFLDPFSPHLEQFCWPLLMLFWIILKRKGWARNFSQTHQRLSQPV